MTRIPYPSLDNLSKLKHDWVFEPGRKYLLNVTKMTLHIPDGLWGPSSLVARGTVLWATIDKRLREMIIVRVGWLQQSEYELYHHRSIARGVGISEEQLAALESDDAELPLFSEAERAMIRYATEVTRDISPSDATLAEARAHYSDELLFEVIVIIGHYMMTARIVAVGGVETDEPAVTAW